ncbi:hypothetical protein [Shewanella sp. c952]|uniref:hypothetical protein n=1 Tax=Shewanella sp. c952 TaxID=2815913 RepID=UPI001C7DA991|nr:hypothetical protein [Shewanella sp. c952]
MKTQSRLDFMMKAVHRVLELPRMTRFAFAMDVIVAVERLDMVDMLAAEGISFASTGDVHNDARVNAQKLFRWLGQYEGQHPIVDRLFYVEQAIVSAMPTHLRVNYLNDVYSAVGVTVVADQRSDNIALKPVDMAVALTKENAEAQVAVIHLGEAPSNELVANAYRELKESAATTQASMVLLELEYPFLTNKRVK